MAGLVVCAVAEAKKPGGCLAFCRIGGPPTGITSDVYLSVYEGVCCGFSG
ncbi:hypothetical protein RSc0954 [Ralstonia pseudosolanacearum GMI1000]|uniref:Uncharacterized protein n=1 Tax=Ralstonia nicotianae (strain ATCC BAA-1114 / GMI1000) TaxID=267608 RepID=Q8Y0T9_RALN1|nr:hypothetical protein RSc0954 [Ralstonia pseudosolanacearum GMI1000]